MNINSLVIFYQVVRLGSFAEASRQLNMPISTVSRLVQQLEKDLNLRLLNRTTRSLQLTEHGTKVLKEAEGLQHSVERIQDIAFSQTPTPKGLIRMTAPQSFINWPLSDWMIEFKQRYPSIDLDLVAGNRLLDLQEERLDFAFRQGPLPDSSLIAKKLFELNYGIFSTVEVSEKYPLTTPEDLLSVPTIGISAHGKHLPWILKKQGKNFEAKHHATVYVEDLDLVIKMLQSGLGYGYVSEVKAQSLLEGKTLEPALKNWWPDAVGFYVVYQSKEYLPEKNRVFLEFIQEKSSDGLL